MWPFCYRAQVVIGSAALMVFLLVACGTADQLPNEQLPNNETTLTTLEASSRKGNLDLIVDNVVTGLRITVATPNELQEQLSFSIVFPEHLPPGVQLTGITAFVGGPGIRGESVNLFFSSTDGAGGFLLDQTAFNETMGSPAISGDDVEEVSIGDSTGLLQEVNEPERQFISMVWTGCGVSFNLTASGQSSREDLIQIAESTLTCQGLSYLQIH